MNHNSNPGRFNSGGVSQANFNPGGVTQGNFNSGGVSQGNFNPGGVSQANFNPGGVSQGNFNPGGVTQGNFNSGVINQGNFNPGGVTQGNFNPGSVTQGNFNPGGINQGNFNPGGINPNHFNPGHNNNNAPIEPQREEKPASPLIEKIQQLGQTNVPQLSQDSKIHCLTIVGQIEGHLQLPPQNKTTKYEHLIPQIVAIEQNPKIEGLLVILNTVGGDVEAGLAISEMLASLSKPSVSIVLGGGHSIGVPIAVATDYSFIAETATMTIHPIRLTGLVIGVPQTFEYLDKMQERVVSFVTKHSNITEEKFKDLMFEKGNLTRDIGTNVIGSDAVEYGLIDEVGGIGQAMKKLDQLIEMNKQKNQGLIQ